MNNVLEQNDVDSLLHAAENTNLIEETEDLQIFSRLRRSDEEVEIREYDFKRPERISKDQMRALHTLHETFARNFSASLSGFLRTIVEVRVAQAEQMTYSEFIATLPNPTSFNLITSDELDGQVCLELSPLIIYPIIDRLLGGSNHDLFIPQRAMTMIETRLIGKILNRGLTALSEAWEGLNRVTFKLGEMESNPQIVQIVPPNEVVVVIGFEIKMTNRAGTMSLCIPFNVIEPLVNDLSAHNWFLHGKARDDHRWEELIEARISDARLELAAVLAETEISMTDLRNLEVGDIIMTDKPAASEVIVTAEGRPKFLAHIGQYRDNRAVRIVRRVKASDRL